MCKKYDVYTMSQFATRIMQLYNMYNNHCFGGVLPKAVITAEEGKGKAYGWTYNAKMWQQGRGAKYSIKLASEHLNNLETMQITLLHEMCHLYAMEQGIKDTTRNGYYHNKNFAEIATKAGLIVTQEKQGAATRSMSAELKQWLDEECPIRSIRIVWKPEGKRQQDRTEGEPEQEAGADGQEEKPKKKSGYYVYKCPTCGATARTTKAEQLLACCGTTEQQHEPELMKIEN